MKTSTIIPTIFSFILVFFMSFSSIANSNTSYSSDNIKSVNEKSNKGVKNTNSNMSPTENEFSNLRFDVNKFNRENASIEAPMESTDYLRFNVNNFIGENTPEMTELPVINEFEYLRFDVNTFTKNNNTSEIPVNEFCYLRFDVTHFDYTAGLSEMPVM